MSTSVTILALESSCDDTAAAVCRDGRILSGVVSTQLKHAALGGVVPEMASRLHLSYITPVVSEALAQAGVPPAEVDAVAVTAGPGLLGSLLVGAAFAKGMALALNRPLVQVHHMQGHLLSLFLEEEPPPFPFLCLTVSGGHTQLVRVNDYLAYEVLGATRDDAAGEAFDKIAKLLGLPYPGGPHVDRWAQQGDPNFHRFPTPDVGSYDFSFSGLKTSFLYYLKARAAEDPDFVQKHLADLCASAQHRIVTFLLDKLFAAAEATGLRALGVVGGVSANSYLRARFAERCAATGCKGYLTRPAYATDNAAMIALTGYYQFLRGDTTDHYMTCFAAE